MSTYVTEVVTFNLRESVTRAQLTDPSGAHIAGLEILKQQEGFQKVLWGVTIPSVGPDPHKLFWFVEWDDIASHQKFQAQPYYQSFVNGILVITDTTNPAGPITVTHYPLSPPLSTIYPPSTTTITTTFTSPKVEYLSAMLKDDADPAKLAQDLSPLTEAVAAAGVPSTFAFAVENPRVMLVLNVWRDLDQNIAFAASESFKKAAGPLGGASAGPPVVMHLEILG
ncbi:hypothetical protein TWF696_007793 [Orbilia brochopaga]|uniref:ABM domain-containing protein n=1 Tax=Orbilia brochopaga TaxID=3140254 RepID=A0AAV9USE4_9PEZI